MKIQSIGGDNSVILALYSSQIYVAVYSELNVAMCSSNSYVHLLYSLLHEWVVNDTLSWNGANCTWPWTWVPGEIVDVLCGILRVCTSGSRKYVMFTEDKGTVF